jgi:hypothetical protein
MSDVGSGKNPMRNGIKWGRRASPTPTWHFAFEDLGNAFHEREEANRRILSIEEIPNYLSSEE